MCLPVSGFKYPIHAKWSSRAPPTGTIILVITPTRRMCDCHFHTTDMIEYKCYILGVSIFQNFLEIGSVVKNRFTNIELVISKPRATILSTKLVVLCTYYYKIITIFSVFLNFFQMFDKLKNTEGKKQDLRSRGLCLVPISSTFPVANETPVDFWTPTFGGTYK